MKQLPFFVYGTLLPGQPNDFYWADKIVQSVPAVLDQVTLYAFSDYPMMIEELGCKNQVIGQAIWVRAEHYTQLIAELDQLEVYNPADHKNSLYLRVERIVHTADGAKIPAWVYLGKAKFVRNLPIVANGDWEKHISKNQISVQ